MSEKNIVDKGPWKQRELPDLEREPRFGVKVLAAEKIGNDILVLRLERPPGFVFSPGQYVWLVLPARSAIQGVVDRRAFSISSSTEDDQLEILACCDEGEYLKIVGELKAGDGVEIIGPMGSVFKPSLSGALVIAEGAGLSPFLSMARSQLPGSFGLYWFGKEYLRSAYRPELVKFSKTRGNDFFEGDSPTAEALGRFFAIKGDPRPIIVSGSQEFVNFVAKTASDMKVKPERMRYEAVYPLSPTESEIVAVFSGVDSSGHMGNRAAGLDHLALMKLLADDAKCDEKTCSSVYAVFLSFIVFAEFFLAFGARSSQGQPPYFLIGAAIVFLVLAVTRKAIKNNGVKSHIIVGSYFFLLALSQTLPDYDRLLVPWSLTLPLVAGRFVRSRAAFYYSVSYLAVFCSVWAVKLKGALNMNAPDQSTLIQTVAAMVLVILLTQFFARRDRFNREKMIKKDESQRQFLLQLEKSNRLSQVFTQIFQETGSPVFFTDSNGRILYANRAVEKLTGYSFSEMRYQTPRLWGGLMDERFYKSNWGNARSGEGFVSEIVNRRRDGRLYATITHVTPLVSMRDGRVFAYVATEEDITALKEIDKAKTEFVSLASHQLQTPLASINWYAEILGSGDAGKMTARQKTYLEEIGAASKRMAELVGALLNVSRIDMGRFAISPKSVDLEKILKSAVAEQEFAIDGKHQRLALSIGEIPESFLADPKLLYIIFQNLLSNAVKYTPDNGQIKIVCGLTKANETFGNKVLPETALSFAVSDTGFGIPRAQQPKIFNKLFRADNAKNMVTDGTGLGLYIVKSIIGHAGGEIWFESEENKGSTFYFTLPSTGMHEKSGDRTID